MPNFIQKAILAKGWPFFVVFRIKYQVVRPGRAGMEAMGLDTDYYILITAKKPHVPLGNMGLFGLWVLILNSNY